ncbi:MAG TPA: cell division protein FtsA, partial [Dehalococcoidales bacterium]|nr:cell division protein FtsA [Dehalococcoidales bacterium]
MAKRRTISAIDVGTTKVCTLIAEVGDNGQMRIAGVGNVPSKGMHKGMVVNINEAKETIRDSVKKAEQSSGYKVESAYIGVTGRSVTGQNNKGVVAVTRNDRLVRPDDLRRVLQNAQSMKMGADQKILHMIPRHYGLDGQDGVQNPIGMHGFKLDAETHVITTGVASVQNLVKCIRGVGVDVEDLVFEALARSEACLTEDDKMAGTILADIGGGTTDISVFKDGSIWHTAVVPVAGYQMTRDIAIGLGLPFDVAEEMKKKYGTALPVYEGKAENDSIAQNGHNISYQGLCDIIRARMEEILRLIILELPSGEQNALVPGGLVLTGGSSNLAGIDALGRDVLKMPVRVGAPLNIYGISDQLNDPAYATAVGLLVWGMKPKSNYKPNPNVIGTGIATLMTPIRGL